MTRTAFVHHRFDRSSPARWRSPPAAGRRARGRRRPRRRQRSRSAARTWSTVQSRRSRVGPLVSGELRPQREATVRAEIGGSVLQVVPDEGQAVAAGALLARIEARTLQDALRVGAVGAALGRADAREWAQNAKLARTETPGQGRRARRARARGRRATPRSQAKARSATTRGRGSPRRARRSTTRPCEAPIAGIVSQRHVNAGDVVSPGGELYTIIDPSSMRLEASVPSEQLARHHGRRDRSTSRCAAIPDRRFEGRIERISPTADPVDAPGADLRDHPQHAAAGWWPACSPRAASSSEVEAGAGRAADRGQRARRQRPGCCACATARRERVDVTLGLRDEQTERVEIAARRRRGRPAAGRRRAGHDAGHAACRSAPGASPS